jgi:hypothetical protein
LERKTAQFKSELDRNVARQAEMAEQRRRVEELDARHKLEQKEREVAHQKVIEAEEKERAERIANDPESHKQGFPFHPVHIMDF